MVTIESRIIRLLADFAASSEIEHVEAVALRHLRDVFGCDAAYFAAIGPRFVENSPPYFQRILADPQRYDPGQQKARQIMARFGHVFIDTEAYSPAERDRSRIFRELHRPAGISSVVLAAVHLAGRTTGMIHLVRSGRPFRAEALVAARPLLSAISIMHQAVVGLPVTMPTPLPKVATLHVLARLSPREREVATFAATGCGAVQIAARLGTSVHTVRRQLESIYRKCEVGNRVDLAALVTRIQGEHLPGIIAGNTRLRDGFLRIIESVNLRPTVRTEDWEAFG